MKNMLLLHKHWRLRKSDEATWMDIPRMPMQVHEILRLHGRIDEKFDVGLGEEILWVAQSDWVYRLDFAKPEGLLSHVRLVLDELDTLCEVKLNNQVIGEGKSMFLPLSADIENLLQDKNTLEITFFSPWKYLDEHPMPERWGGKVRHYKLIRKPPCDFHDYLGARPYITPMGVAGDIRLETYEESEMIDAWVEALPEDTFAPGAKCADKGNVRVRIQARDAIGLTAKVQVKNPQGEIICLAGVPVISGHGEFLLNVEKPELWYPRGYGRQPLYDVLVELCDEAGNVIDRAQKQVGFRIIRTDINFHCVINGLRIMLLGSNVSPLDGKTHAYNRQRMTQILDMAELANMNVLRVWGESEPLPDDFYAQCDRRGILVWQDFFHFYGLQPDTPEYVALCVKEAAHMVKRLRHHASIFMWCGGNEGPMGRDFDYEGEEEIGDDIFFNEYPALLKQMDPDRYYHANTPMGGDYYNDPRQGDTHGYDMWWFDPGAEYPVAVTEYMRASAPALKSLKRFIPENELWPEGFVDTTPYSTTNLEIMPPAWMYHTRPTLWLQSGAVHTFRDATTPEQLTYKFSAAHAWAFRKSIARSRMGRPTGSEGRICNCHMIWKLFDTWPLIYSAIIDYWLEPFMPYYEAKRGYQPVVLRFDMRDHINLWLVNDTLENVEGTLEYGVFNPKQNRFIRFASKQVSIAPQSAEPVANYDEFGGVRMENIVYGRLVKDGKIICDHVEYLDIERRLVFPDAQLDCRMDGDELCIRSDKFAYCVEISGNADGDEFGWLFEDNYFDLMPDTEKRVKVLGKHSAGEITIKTHYGTKPVTLAWKR